jgi:sulfite exporter TauE/SafE
MTELSLLSAFLIGLAGSLHCVGMCGGIVTSFSLLLLKHTHLLTYILAYNAGRITTYTLAGILTGMLGAMISTTGDQARIWLDLISGFFLILFAGYIGNWWSILRHFENVGRLLWRHIQPFSKQLLPLQTPWQGYLYGIVWGWLPCGLIYSTLSWSLASGHPLQGGLIMLSFGLGTLPAMLALSAGAAKWRTWLQTPLLKHAIGLTLLLAGLLLIHNALQRLF